ncbi:MAG TPA: ROK family protein [Terrimesophilobacter sp.]|nr:ROK family protein [Terrimesophilobacter sp.]
MPHDLALAIDLGGTKVEASLVDREGTLVDGSRSRESTGAAKTSDELAASVRAVVTSALAALPMEGRVSGVGIGAAGPIRQAEGLVSPLNLPAWRDYPLHELVSEIVNEHAADLVADAPVTLRMDGLCITLAEHWVGAAQGVGNVLGMVVSTGIGGGLILGGHTVPGPTGNAGHIGHVEVAGFDDPCACGGRGCLEAVASGPRSVAWAREQGWTGTTGEELAESYAAGDGVARAAIMRSGRAIGRAIGSVTALVDLELVAVGGGFSRATPDLFDHIRIGIDEHSGLEFTRKVRVVPSLLSDIGPLVGAAALVHRADLL